VERDSGRPEHDGQQDGRGDLVVEVLTITIITTTEDTGVSGWVTAAITASRSAATVIVVAVRARWNSVTPIRNSS